MDYFNYKNGELYCEDVPAAKIAAEVGTACYVYSKATLLHHYRQVADSFKELNPTVCYSIKSNGNINLCKVLAEAGSGFDVTSGGELFRALQAGGDPKKMIYAGVGKTDREIADGITAGIAAFNIESEAEIENIDRIAGEMGKSVVAALRINPDVDARTHAKTTTGRKGNKFGVVEPRRPRQRPQVQHPDHDLRHGRPLREQGLRGHGGDVRRSGAGVKAGWTTKARRHEGERGVHPSRVRSGTPRSPGLVRSVDALRSATERIFRTHQSGAPRVRCAPGLGCCHGIGGVGFDASGTVDGERRVAEGQVVE